MRFEHFTNQKLDESVDLMEVNMSPSALKQFANSPEAKGIQAGFEAEMIFPGMGGSGDDSDAEYPEADDESVRDIDDAVRFFSEDNSYSGNGLYSRDQNRFQEWLQELYYEWLSEKVSEKWSDEGRRYFQDWMEENRFDTDWTYDKLEEVLRDEEDDDELIEKLLDGYRNARSTKQIDDRVRDALVRVNEIKDEEIEEAWDSEDSDYDSARDEFRDEVETDGDYDENSWLSEEYPYMSDIHSLAQGNRSCPVDLYWPDGEPEFSGPSGDYDYDNAQDLARSLRQTLDVNAKANSDYHDGRPANTWILEPDGSLQPDDEDDMPVEIISPPMPLEECLTKIDQFFEWAADHDAYTNRTTGFHVGVSLPYRGGDVDYIKLALFLGDKYVLEQFQRSSNTYCKSALKVIQEYVAQGKAKPEDVMNLMRHNLLELAHRSIRNTTNKYESINMKGGKYIEFRSMGNEGYNNDPAKLKDIIRRYSYAMYLAGNPSAERNEYYKKLYKLVSPEHSDILNLFAAYNSGEINTTELKERWSSAVSREFTKDQPQAGGEVVAEPTTKRQSVAKKIQQSLPRSFWEVQISSRNRFNPGTTVVVAASANEAGKEAVKKTGIPHGEAIISAATPVKKFKASIKGVSGEPKVFYAKDLTAAQERLRRIYATDDLSEFTITELGPETGTELS